MAFTFEKTIKSPNFDLKIAFDINTRTKIKNIAVYNRQQIIQINND